MNWKVNDIKYLKDGGYSEEDIKQIKTSGKYLKLTYIREDSTEKKINQPTALSILGRKEFVSGMARSAFHYTAMRDAKNGNGKVYFDCSAMFKE